MTWTTRRSQLAQAAGPLILLLMAGGLGGCGALDVSDPTTIQESDVNSADGAELLRHGALATLYDVAGNAAWDGGLLADEFLFQQADFWDQLGVSSADELLDRRASDEQQSGGNNSYASWQELWGRKTVVALVKLKAYAPAGARPHIGEMFAVRGFAALRLAEDFCPGFPLHDVVDYKVVYGPPLSTEQAFERALANFDSALTWAADSARILDFARVGRARTLVNLGRFAEAAAAVTDVPDDYVYQTEYSTTIPNGPTNPLAIGAFGWGDERSLADREGGTGLDFVSADDPRVPTDSLGTARDGVTILYGTAKYSDMGSPIVLASGVEARLIEAEAALRAGDPTTWLSKLNQLRQTAALPDTTDPGADAARLDLTFRERAFWLFGTGHRLGDLRRLIRQYSLATESVFPTGAYWRGGMYGNGTNIPLPAAEVQLSPGVTGCTSR